jgi:hypothetical protein
MEPQHHQAWCCSPVEVADEPDTTTAGLTPSADVALALSTDTAMPPLLASALLVLMAAPGPLLVAVLLATATPSPAPFAVELATAGPPLLVAVALAMALEPAWRRRVLACIGVQMVEVTGRRWHAVWQEPTTIKNGVSVYQVLVRVAPQSVLQHLQGQLQDHVSSLFLDKVDHTGHQGLPILTFAALSASAVAVLLGVVAGLVSSRMMLVALAWLEATDRLPSPLLTAMEKALAEALPLPPDATAVLLAMAVAWLLLPTATAVALAAASAAAGDSDEVAPASAEAVLVAVLAAGASTGAGLVVLAPALVAAPAWLSAAASAAAVLLAAASAPALAAAPVVALVPALPSAAACPSPPLLEPASPAVPALVWSVGVLTPWTVPLPLPLSLLPAGGPCLYQGEPSEWR